MSLQTIVTPLTDKDQEPSSAGPGIVTEVPWVPPVPPATSATYFGSFLGRVLQDALQQASAEFWDRRAVAFEWAAPRPGEFHGNLTTEQLREKWLEMQGTAAACRAHANLIRQGLLSDQTQDEIEEHLSDEVAEMTAADRRAGFKVVA